MTHCIIHQRVDGIDIGGAFDHTVAAMMGDGGLMGRAANSPITPLHLAFIMKYAATNPAAQAILDLGDMRPLIELDYEISKGVIIDGISEVVERPFCEAKAFGGVATEGEAIHLIGAHDAYALDGVIGCHVIDRAELPMGGDRTFRDAWCWQIDHCEVNMPQARGIHMDRIRVVRNAELAAKDITFMRAVEAGDTSAQSTIATEKQTLRDIPQTFDLTTDTPEQLKTKWPTSLPSRES